MLELVYSSCEPAVGDVIADTLWSSWQSARLLSIRPSSSRLSYPYREAVTNIRKSSFAAASTRVLSPPAILCIHTHALLASLVCSRLSSMLGRGENGCGHVLPFCLPAGVECPGWATCTAFSFRLAGLILCSAKRRHFILAIYYLACRHWSLEPTLVRWHLGSCCAFTHVVRLLSRDAPTHCLVIGEPRRALKQPAWSCVARFWATA